jgi:hypothetical protein
MEQSKHLSLVELLNIADEAYDDGYLAEYFDPGTGASRTGLGDTLAEFIVREIRDTFDPNATRSQQLEEARRVLMNAIDDLENVIERLQ